MPFIVTLGTYTVYRGLATWLASSTTVYVPGDVKPWWFSRIMEIEPEPRWLLVAPGVWVFLALEHPGGGRAAIQPAGPIRLRHRVQRGDRAAVRNQRAVDQGDRLHDRRPGDGPGGRLAVRLLSARWATRRPAGGLELQVIAAVVIGGGSLSGGEGTVLGTLIGCLIMPVLKNGCVHAGIPNPSQDIIIGIIIVAAVTLDRLRRSKGL